MSAMLGVPFPFGSIGRVNSQLYSLGAGTSLSQDIQVEGYENDSSIMRWMQHYVNALCINAWQVKRYIDVYSASSVIGFPYEDLLHVADMYSLAQENWLHVVKGSLSCVNESCPSSLPALKKQIDMYVQFLDRIIELARSKWTEFNLKLMVTGLGILFLSLLVQLVAIKRVGKFYASSLSVRCPQASVGLVFSISAVAIRACSFLSNSYILEEGKVAIFLLGTSVILKLRNSIKEGTMLLEAILLLFLVIALRFLMELGLSKQSDNLSSVASMLGISQDHLFWIALSLSVPILALSLLAYMLLRYISSNFCQRVQKYVILGTILCYVLIASLWILDSNLISLPVTLHYIGRSYIPRVIYSVGIVQLVALVINQLLRKKRQYFQNDLPSRIVAMITAWSSAIILLSGKQGSVIALATVGAACCIVRLEKLGQAAKDGSSTNISFYSLPTTQWSLLAVALFFCSGHWCAFDGLRYGAAFVGFDEFVLVRQAILLAIDTFGFSHLFPIFGLPILIAQQHSNYQKTQGRLSLSVQLSQIYLMYGCIVTSAVAFMVLCVTIQRRHLMVWGLFAPKFVFDVVGLILTDVLICLGSLYYIDPVEDDTKQN